MRSKYDVDVVSHEEVWESTWYFWQDCNTLLKVHTVDSTPKPALRWVANLLNLTKEPVEFENEGVTYYRNQIDLKYAFLCLEVAGKWPIHKILFFFQKNRVIIILDRSQVPLFSI